MHETFNLKWHYNGDLVEFLNLNDLFNALSVEIEKHLVIATINSYYDITRIIILYIDTLISNLRYM